MGADGHIRIYDLEAIKKEVTREELDIIRSAMVYEQTMQGQSMQIVTWL
jgi:hypothetical protein